MNKRFFQIISLSIITVILLCGSFLLPFHLLKNTTNTEIHSDSDDESSSDQGNTNAAEVQCSRLFSHYFSVLTTTAIPFGVSNVNRLENHQVRRLRIHFESHFH